MKTTASLLFGLVSLLLAVGAHAQLYKSVAADGKITYSDLPSASAAKIEHGHFMRRDKNELGHELAEALKKNPVTLYTTGKCKPCDEGRDLLRQRGIPFSEKTVATNDDLAAFRQAGGDQQLPLLTIGDRKEQEFEAKTWHAALTAANYPLTNKLPKTYQNPEAVAAAGQKPAAPPAPIAADTAPRQPAAPAVPTTPTAPGFRF